MPQQGATRGWMGQVLLGAIDVVKGLVLDHGVDIVSALATKKLDGRVEAGVYELSADELQPLKGSGRKRDSVAAAADGGPMLVLVHGTFVDTVSTFGKLWTLHPQRGGDGCSRTTAAASTRSTTRRWAPARSPTR